MPPSGCKRHWHGTTGTARGQEANWSADEAVAGPVLAELKRLESALEQIKQSESADAVLAESQKLIATVEELGQGLEVPPMSSPAPHLFLFLFVLHSVEALTRGSDQR